MFNPAQQLAQLGGKQLIFFLRIAQQWMDFVAGQVAFQFAQSFFRLGALALLFGFAAN